MINLFSMAKVYLGCSGYLYPHWRGGIFYPKNLAQKQEFVYYANLFNSVEINSTFYGQPQLKTWDEWRQRAPQGFVYGLKVSRFLTHQGRLRRPKKSWDRFWRGAQRLKEHLGVVLFQLPPRFKPDLKRLEKLPRVLPRDTRFAFEFRDRRWFDKKVYQILRKNNWALVMANHPQLPWIQEKTADFVYLRFHGKPELYRSSYPNSELKRIAQLIRQWLKQGLDVYAYFNNDALGNAPRNALFLKRLLKKSHVHVN